MRKLRIGALISGGGSNLQAVIDACEAGRINGEVVFVGSDNPKAFGLERAKKHKIDTFTVDYASIIRSYRQDPERAFVPDDFSLAAIAARQTIVPAGRDAAKLKAFLITRAIAEAELLKKMKPYPFDLLILAGFMRNLTPYFIDRVNTVPDEIRIMNIHPALLPAFPGVDGYGDTFRYGSKVGGCTVHFIDYGEDSGPIIGQRAFRIDENDTLESIKAKGLELEWELYPECIQLFAEGRLKTEKMKYKMKGGTFQRTVVKISGK
ncbi:MAG: phosphoribosylglycinamide formyltransferase [Desulfobacterales bacterium]|nr:phosphoribosylglycinamide formyltransferase [Desulfobacterales bacterium]